MEKRRYESVSMSGLNNKAYQGHLTSSRDLETSYEAVRAGFVAMALEKNRRATPYIDEARVAPSNSGSKQSIPFVDHEGH